jgi:hypothetical protein
VEAPSGGAYQKIDEGAEVLEAYSWEIPLDEGLVLSFIGDADGGGPTASLSGWQPLAALAARDSIGSQLVSGAASEIWPLTLRLDNGMEFSVGVQFGAAEELEDLRETWPRRDEWPGG